MSLSKTGPEINTGWTTLYGKCSIFVNDSNLLDQIFESAV